MAGEIKGLNEALKRLTAVTEDMVERVAIAVEVTAIRISNHAKAGHQKGKGHANGRYDNQTSVLTNSIFPEIIKKTRDEVVGTVSTSKDYAPYVEFGGAHRKGGERRAYPFMFPAADSQREKFPKSVMRAIRGGNA